MPRVPPAGFANIPFHAEGGKALSPEEARKIWEHNTEGIGEPEEVRGPMTHYKTVPQLYEWAASLEKKFGAEAGPGLVKLEDIGQTHEGRPIQVLTLGSGAKSEIDSPSSERRIGGLLGRGLERLARTADRIPFARAAGDHLAKVGRFFRAKADERGDTAAEKPRVLFLGGVHARETSNPEFLLRWAQELLEAYGKDPVATAILDTVEIKIVFMLNPDGRAKVDAGQRMQRKNTNPVAGGNGVDLNRANDDHWGVSGTSKNPNSDTFGGLAPNTELESQAFSGLILNWKPHLFWDLHSSGGVNLYPPGWTEKPGSEDADYIALAKRVSAINSYRTLQAGQMYPASGATDDYADTHSDAASMTLETCPSFHNDDATHEKHYQLNKPALTYAALIAQDPFKLARGPDAQNVVVEVDGTVKATVTDQASGNKPIVAAEMVFDPLVPAGQGVPLQAVDGAFDAATETVTGKLPEPPPGTKLAYVRGQDADGNWGPAMPVFIKQPE